VDAFETYRRLRRASPAPHSSFVRIGATCVAGASPESFLEVTADGVVSSSPIKGTRPRSVDPVVDDALAAELVASEKERAENVMIVDLVRNDLTRVARLGSVVVDELLAVRSYPAVHQLVSTVSARLAAGLGALDVLEAAFPAGSMTGAPKRRAVELLSEAEGAHRGVYSGAVGVLGLDGSASWSMAIRSVVVTDGVATVGVGGGVTASSVPGDELAEVVWKATALLRVLGVDAGGASS
jgi:para-aminobenzoate synthetase component 1